jgi:hypothetical protein
MRQEKKFKIDGWDNSFTVKELTVKEILSLFRDGLLEDTSFEGLQKQFADVLLPMSSDIEMKDLEEMAPSELEQVWDVFQKVNAAFFKFARKAGLADIVTQLKNALIGDSLGLLVNSWKQGTAESGTTDTDTSSTP